MNGAVPPNTDTVAEPSQLPLQPIFDVVTDAVTTVVQTKNDLASYKPQSRSAALKRILTE